MKDYKSEFMRFFETQLTKQGGDIDNQAMMQTSAQKQSKMPKRKKHYP